MNARTMILDGEEYVVIPRAAYEKTMKAKLPPGTVDALDFMTAAIAADLRAAREHAGLTQNALAEKLGKSQPMVSGAETGSIAVGEAYVAAVLKACGLPKMWKPEPPAKRAPVAEIRKAKKRRASAAA